VYNERIKEKMEEKWEKKRSETGNLPMLHSMVKLKGEAKYDLNVPVTNLVGRYGIVTEEYGTMTCEVGVPLTEIPYMASVCVPRKEVNELMDYYQWMNHELDFHGDLKKWIGGYTTKYSGGLNNKCI